MKITLQNYQTAAADVDTSKLLPEAQSMHELLLKYGAAVADGADAATQEQLDYLLAQVNGKSGGSQAPAAPATKRTRSAKPKLAAATKTPTAKAAPSATSKATTKPAPAGGNVRGISVAVKLIRGFVQLLGKDVPGSRIVAKMKSVQQAMLDGQVTKKTPHAKEVDEVQDLLIKAVKSHKLSAASTDLVKLTMSDADAKAKLVGLAGGEQVFESVAVLRAFVRLSGKTVTKQQIDNLLKRTASPKIKDGDPFQEELKAIHAALKKATPDKVLSVATVGLSGTRSSSLASDLSGIVKAVDKHATAAKKASLVRRASAPGAKKKALRPGAKWKRPTAQRRKKAQAR